MRFARLVWWGSREAKKGRLTPDKRVWGTIEILKTMESLGVTFEVENTFSFRDLDSPCVFVSNHMSTMETFLFTAIIEPYRDISYVIKESLVKYPVFKHIMMSHNPVIVSRRNAREDFQTVLKEGTERLERNISMVVFPQTTRSIAFNPGEFNSIGVKLAKRAKVPVVPVALRTDAWGNSRHFIKEFGPIDPSKPVHFCFGDPVYVEGSGRMEHQRIVDFIAEKVHSWF